MHITCFYLAEVPHMKSSLVAVSKYWLSIRAEQTTKEAEITSTNFTHSYLQQHNWRVTTGCWLTELRFCIPFNTKLVILEMFFPANFLAYHTATTTVLRPFFRNHPGEPVPKENFLTLWCKGKLTEADTPTICDHPTVTGSLSTTTEDSAFQDILWRGR